MADRYWVGGSGNWDASSTANWSASSGGASGASAPTSADNVIFDASSGSSFTVTMLTGAVCNDFSTSGTITAITLSLGISQIWDVHGSLTFPATGLIWSGGTSSQVYFLATTTGKTVTTNGVSFGGSSTVRFDGAGGGWTLGSALTCNSLLITQGTFSTGNFTITVSSQFNGSGSLTRSISLGSSTITSQGTTAWSFGTTTNLTFNAGTSTITCSNASPTFTGGGLTYYNVTFSSASSGTTTINGANTFNNLTQTSRSATGNRFISLGADQTVSGTLTIGAANTAIRRIRVASDVIGTRRTITLNGTLATLADVDFRDIGAAGTVATPWTGTRLGDALNNNNITFAAAKTVYWNLSGTQNWSATGWATTNNGTPATNNFPLVQDTATFTEAGSAGTITIDQGWQIGTIQMADGVSNRTTAFTLATGTQTPSLYGNVTLFSNLTLTGTGTFNFLKQGATAVITSAGISFTQSLTVSAPSGTFQLADNLTNTGTAFTLTSGTLDLSSGNRTLTCVTFSSSNSNTRSISFGTGNITVTGNAATIFTTATATGFTVTGTPVVNATYSGSTGTRGISFGNAGEANAISVNVSAGTDTINLVTTSGSFKNIDFTGFSGTMAFSNSINIFGNFTLSTGMTVSSGTQTPTFAATSGTQQITTNGKTIDYNLTVNAPGATVQLQDALALGSTRTLTLTAGTFDANNKNCTTGLFSSSNTNVRTLTMGSGTWTISGTGTVWDITTTTNMTLNANTSSIVMTGTGANVTFSGGGLTYYNVTAPDSLYRIIISGANTYNNLTLSNTTAGEKTAQVPSSLTQTVNGVFSATGSSGNCRIVLFAGTFGTAATISAASVSLSDIDFRDIDAAGAAIPWTGTRLGDCGGNSDITFAAPKTVYWNKVAGGNWSDNAWATSSGGATATTNQPLPQDTAIFDNVGINAGSTVSFTASEQTGAWDCSALTNAVTFDFQMTIGAPSFFGNIALSSSSSIITSTASTLGIGIGKRSGTQTITSSGVSWGTSLTFQANTAQFVDNLTTAQTATLNNYTLDLNGKTLTCDVFSSSNTNTRSIAFNSGNIAVTGNNKTVWVCGDLTNFSYTGTPTVNFTYSGSVGTRSVANGVIGLTESNAVDFNIVAGGDIWSSSGTPNGVRNWTFQPAFTGSSSFYAQGFIYGNVLLSPNQTVTAGSAGPTFAATSGTKTITTNGVTIDRPLTFDGVGGTWTLQDALTIGSTTALTITNGTFNANNYNITCGSVALGSGTKTINMGSGTWTIQGSGWDALTNNAGLTLNSNTSTISLTSASTKTFAGAGATYYNFNQGGAGTLTISGSNTFNTISNTTQPATVTFTNGTTQTVNNFNLSGTSGNLVTINSTSPGSQFTLAKNTGGKVLVSYLSITDSVATPNGYWFAPTSQGNVDGGNNVGWNFGSTGLSGFFLVM